MTAGGHVNCERRQMSRDIRLSTDEDVAGGSFVYGKGYRVFYDELETQASPTRGQTRVFNPSAWGHLNPSSYCDVGKLFYGVFKLWSKLQRKKLRNNF